MTQAAVSDDRDFLDLIFGPVISAQTYRNLVYLLLAFPLGIGYFAFLICGLSIGTGLLVLFIGIPILMGVLAGCRGLGAFERRITQGMLHVTIAAPPQLVAGPGLWTKSKALFGSATTWRSFFYLFLKFPFGIAVFSLLAAVFSGSLAMMLTPFIYRSVPVDYGLWQVHTDSEATVLCFAGVALLVASLYLVNGLALVWGRFAQIMLGADPPAAGC